MVPQADTRSRESVTIHYSLCFTEMPNGITYTAPL